MIHILYKYITTQVMNVFGSLSMESFRLNVPRCTGRLSLYLERQNACFQPSFVDHLSRLQKRWVH
jgi:hypothetical protein